MITVFILSTLFLLNLYFCFRCIKMNQFIRNLLGQLFFWLVLFAVERTLFLIWYAKSIAREAIPFSDVLKVYMYGFKLDLSTVGYILIIPVILLSIKLFLNYKWIDKLNTIYSGLVIIIYCIVSVSEIGLYEEWNTKLSYKALVYLQRPDEVINTVQTYKLLLFLFLWIFQSILFIYFYVKVFSADKLKINVKPHPFKSSVVIIATFALLFLMIRGGFKEIPITASDAYFSQFNILNITAVNPGYNIGFAIINHTSLAELKPFFKMEEEEAERMVNEMHYVLKDTTVLISKYSHPNIVFVLLESWPGDVIESYGSIPDITPEFRKLESEGLLFTNFYASGNRSQQGNASIFAGLPAIPITTLSDHPEKYGSVPSLVKILNNQEYYTSFYFGGQLIYGNLKSFLVYNEFDLIVEGADFDKELPRGKLGVHDEFVFNKYANDLQQMEQPFFSTVFTLSSHPPYDYPGERPIDWVKVENEFINSVHYTDNCLGSFFEEIRESTVWDSTLFFIMSDHSHLSYTGYPLWSFEYHQIPLLVTGGALKDEFKGGNIDKICSNMDIPVTILKQLGLPSDAFFWSKNILNPYGPEFAFFELTYGFGWKRPYGDLVKSTVNEWYYQKNGPEDKLLILEEEGYAYTQHLLKEFLSY